MVLITTALASGFRLRSQSSTGFCPVSEVNVRTAQATREV